MRRLFATVLLCVLLHAPFACGQTEDGYSTKKRIARIRQLGKSNPGAIPTLTQYLTDPDTSIRVEAVQAIVKLDSAASLDPLIKAAHDNNAEVQIRATDGLVNFYLPGYVAKGLTGPLTRGVRQVKSFFSSRNEQEIPPDIAIRQDVGQALSDQILHGASLDARANAARAAGILRAGPAVASLQQALRSKDTELILESLYALQKIGDRSAGSGVSFLARDLDDRVQMAALETLGVLRNEQSASDVRSALTHARNAKIRRAALSTLSMLGQPADRKIFQQYASDSDPALRASALEGLGRVREPEDTPVLEEAYNEQNADWRVHFAAAFALVDEGKIDTGEFSPLRYLVDNLEIKERESVAEAYLKELCRRDDVRRAVFPLISNATRDQKVALSNILGASESQDAVPALTKLSQDINPDVALAASRALRMLQARKL